MSVIDFNSFIFLVRNQIVDKTIKINNLKISFLCNKKIDIDNDSCLSYFKGYNLLVKFDKFTYTFLGKTKNHVNITGIKSFLEIEAAIKGILVFSNLNLENFKNFNIDNISASFVTHPGLKEIILNTTNSDFTFFRPVKFCGIIIKYKKCSSTYFNSGKCIIVGLKSISDLNLYVSKIRFFFDKCTEKFEI